MPAEEGTEARLAALEELAGGKGEEARQQQEDDEEDVRYRRGEVAAKLALGDDPDMLHCFAVSGAPTWVSGLVMRRNTSSSGRPSSSGVPCATTRPRSMMIARVQAASTSSRIWVENTTALVLPSSRIRLRTSCFWLGSRPSVGSSSTSTSGSWISACARQVRWR